MVLTPKASLEGEQPGTEMETSAVREQLDRLVNHPLFSNSKRYPALLSYTVEQTLEGKAGDLKERSIGVEVFGRAPSYDSNADPVVRITAGEVRKRLSQYYYDTEHQQELVIELPVGSYVPVFRLPDRPEPSISALDAAGQPELVTGQAAQRRSFAGMGLRGVLIAGAAVLLSLAIGAGIGMRFPATPPPTSMDRFWEPVISSPTTATFCVGPAAAQVPAEPDRSAGTAAASGDSPRQTAPNSDANLSLADVITLTRAASTLERHSKTFRVVLASQVSFAQLREGPIVLIGARDNVWTQRLTRNLRFGFDISDGVARLVDRKDASSPARTTEWDPAHRRIARDYAIVARMHDNTTGQPVIIAAGLSEDGTEAAGEILYNRRYLDSLLAKAPPDWAQKNLEAVIETQVIEGHPGPPRVLAVESW